MVARRDTGLPCTPAVKGLFGDECAADGDCDDGDPCNGFERCALGRCQTGSPIGCLPGDVVVTVPFAQPPVPSQVVSFIPEVQAVDAYPLLDRSGSMTAELDSIRSNVTDALLSVACPPAGTGAEGSCIPSLWAGAGTIGYEGVNGQSYRNHLDLQPDFTEVGPSLPPGEPSGCCDETQLFALWSTVTGQGSVAAETAFGSGCNVGTDYSDRASCTGSLAGDGADGYPCFRPDALAVVLIATDEAPTQSKNCPTIPTVAAAANAIGAKIIGLLGSGSTAAVQNDLGALALQTGAVDGSGSPLVFNAADVNAAAAVASGLAAMRASPLTVAASLVDDPSDAVDAVAAFADHVETAQLGTPECSAGLTDEDGDGDGFDERYVALSPGTPVCWRVVARENTVIAATDSPQVFPASLEPAAGRPRLETPRRVLFVVPPR